LFYSGRIKNIRALVAEFIGTFTLIFIGAGAGAISGDLLTVALAHGLVVLGFAYAYGHISGTHINPAVTIGLLVGKQIDILTAAYYIVVQRLGGLTGALMLSVVLGGSDSGLGQPSWPLVFPPYKG
jgi:aquaporin Z